MGKKDKRIYRVSTKFFHFDGNRSVITDYNDFPCCRTLSGFKQYMKHSGIVDFYNRYDDELNDTGKALVKRIPKSDCWVRDSWNDKFPQSWNEMKSWKRRSKRKNQFTSRKTEKYVKQQYRSINWDS